MKITSLSAATLAAALLVGTACAGFPDEDGRSSRKLQGNGRNNDKNNKDKGGNKDKTPGPPDSRDADGGIDLIIKYKNDNGFNKAKGLASNGKIKDISSKKKLAALRVGREKMKDLKDDPDIEYVEIDYEVTALPHVRGSDAAATSSAAERRLAEEIPWGIAKVNAGPGGLAQGSQKHVKVCVVDTGYDNGHPDLPVLAAGSPCGDGLCGDGFTPIGVDLATYGVWNVDGHGHGSHCAGTIGAIGNNGVGVTSVNPDPTKIDFFIGKGLSDSGSGSTSGVLAAAMACKDNGADIISMSLGGGGWGQSSVDTYTEIYDAGVLIIAAAGNGGSTSYSYPASYPQVMSVAATDSSDNKAGFSQWNDQVEIAGPGVGVTSTIPGGYATWSGTSMATPHVAGVAALVWSHFPECTNNHIRNALIQSATDRGSPGCDDEYGFGIVNAQAAYNYLLLNPCQADDFLGDNKSDHAFGGCAQDPDFTYPPTSAPTPFPCDETVATLEILTDYWGYETSWRVLNAAGIEVSNGGSYASQTLYEEKMCLADGEYTLEVNDTYGDGIYDIGYYKLFVGDSLEKHGGAASPDGNFGSQEITPFTVGASAPTATPPTAAPVPPTPAPVVPPTPSPTASCETLCCFPIEDGGTGGWANDYMLGICAAQGCHYETASNGSPYCSGQNYYWTCMQAQCGVDPPTAAPVPPTPAPVVPPTPAPVVPPTPAPVVPPTPAPVVPPTVAPVTPCPVTVSVEILTDNYPGETTWTVTDNAGVLKGSGGPYSSSGTLYTAEVCVEDENVSFHISDSYGDGICCGYGQGSYKVSVGSRQMQAVGQFAHGEATSFGSACGATSVGASTVGREKKASGEACKAHSDCLGDVCLGSGHCE